jgi:hypothetical protein
MSRPIAVLSSIVSLKSCSSKQSSSSLSIASGSFMAVVLGAVESALLLAHTTFRSFLLICLHLSVQCTLFLSLSLGWVVFTIGRKWCYSCVPHCKRSKAMEMQWAMEMWWATRDWCNETTTVFAHTQKWRTPKVEEKRCIHWWIIE